MIGHTPAVQGLRWLAVLLLSLLWATVGSAAALAERDDFSHSALAAKTGGGAVDDLVTVRSYTDATGKAGISGSGSLRADSWVTLPGEVPSRAGHLQIEKLLEIQPGRGSHFLEFQTPRSNLRVPNNGTHTSGGALQFLLNNPTPIDPSTFRRPPGRPAGS